MSARTLTVTEVVRHFSDYLNLVVYKRESFVLQKGRKTIAELRPLPAGRRLGDLPALLRSAPRLSESDASSFEKDINDARAELDSIPLRDPWAS